MPKAARITVRRDPRSPKLPFEVNIPDTLSQSGQRERPHFATLGEANLHRGREEKRLALYSENAFGLTDDEKREMAECKELVRPHGKSVRDVVRVGLAVLDADARSVTIEELAREVEATKRQDKRSARHTAQIHGVMVRFAAAHPGQIVNSFTASQIDAWLRGLGVGAVSRNSYKAILSLAFKTAVRKGWSKVDPTANVERATATKSAVRFLSIEETTRLLAACDPAIVAYVALGAFAGLRAAEAQRLAWTDISRERIQVRAELAKTRKNRFVPVEPNLRDWLARAARDKTGLVGYSRKLFRAAWKTAGFAQWPTNALRHSYATYQWPILEHEGRLAQQMGNSPSMILGHYRGFTDRQTAEKYFAIKP